MFLMLSPGRAFSEGECYCLCNESKNVCRLLPLRESTAFSETLVLTCGNGCPQMMAAPDNWVQGSGKATKPHLNKATQEMGLIWYFNPFRKLFESA